MYAISVSFITPLRSKVYGDFSLSLFSRVFRHLLCVRNDLYANLFPLLLYFALFLQINFDLNNIFNFRYFLKKGWMETIT